MTEALDASGAEVITVAVRRERLYNDKGESLLDAIDLDRYTILPNTAGCFSAEDAVRVSRMGREILEQLGQPRRLVGEARGPRGQEDAAARSARDARGVRGARRKTAST